MASRTFLDLFAGCGGLTRGFIDAGLRPRGGVENNLHAAATYAANFGERLTHYGDIRTFREVPSVDVVIGGPPCQGFSNLGRRDPSDIRNKLWREFARVVRAANCKVFVLENVDRFAASAELASMTRATRRSGALKGFTLEALTLNAADFGTPQRRSRTIVIGSSIGPVAKPVPTHDRDAVGGRLRWRTVADAMGDLPRHVEQIDLPDESDEYFGELVPGRFKLSDIHVGRRYMPRSLDRFKAIPRGGNRLDLPDRLKAPCWLGHHSGSHDVLGRLDWDKPSVTIRTEFFKPEKGRYLHPVMNRAITHAEAAVLQGFDDRHEWCGTKVEIARMIGNAVPPPLAHAIGEAVRRGLRGA